MPRILQQAFNADTAQAAGRIAYRTEMFIIPRIAAQ
jgi:hypothetical protein